MKRIAWNRVLTLAAVVIVCLVAGYIAFTTGEPGVDDAYATIGPETVTVAELDSAYRQRGAEHDDLSRDEYFTQIYAPRTLMLIEAREIGLSVSDDEVDEWVSTINSTLASRNVTFERYLDDLNLTYDELRDDIRSSTLLNRMLTVSVASKVNVSAEEVEAAYAGSTYEQQGIPIEQARDAIGPEILREKQDATLRELIDRLGEKYEVRLV